MLLNQRIARCEKYPWKMELKERILKFTPSKVRKWMIEEYGEDVPLRTVQYWAKAVKQGKLVLCDDGMEAPGNEYIKRMNDMIAKKESEISKKKKDGKSKPGQILKEEQFVFDMYVKMVNLERTRAIVSKVKPKKSRSESEREDMEKVIGDDGLEEIEREILGPVEGERSRKESCHRCGADVTEKKCYSTLLGKVCEACRERDIHEEDRSSDRVPDAGGAGEPESELCASESGD